MLAIQNYQQRLYHHYQKGLSLPPTYRYLHGQPVETRVPIQTTPRPFCLIAPFPPAQRRMVGGEPDVPVGDGWPIWSGGPYFDGRRVTALHPPPALDRAYLEPLGLHPDDCWLTYLVKVFLFRDEDLSKYRRLGCPWPEQETFSQFDTLARRSLNWLAEELALIRPRLVITLGTEVAGVLQDTRTPEAAQFFLNGQLSDLWLDERVYPALHLAWPQPAPAHLAPARLIIERLQKNERMQE